MMDDAIRERKRACLCFACKGAPCPCGGHIHATRTWTLGGTDRRLGYKLCLIGRV